MTKRKLIKGGLLAAACGSLLPGWGCLDSIPWQQVFYYGLAYTGFEFFLDNDAVFDLFQDDFGTGALYDDRCSSAPTRGEIDGNAPCTPG